MTDDTAPSPRRRWLTTAVCLTVAACAVTLAPSADAARKQQTAPPPVTSVAPPANFQVISSESNQAVIGLDAGTGFGHEVQVVSGPSGQPATDLTGGTPVTAFRIDGGGYLVSPLAPSSDYVIRARRTSLFNSTTRTLSTVTSDWAPFAFSTPSLAASRPSTPVLRLGSSTATTVDIVWNASTDNVSTATEIQYTYTANGVFRGATCFSYCFGTTVLRIAKPAPGTSVDISVTATDRAGIASLPSTPLRVTG